MNENDLDMQCFKKSAIFFGATSLICASIMVGNPDSKTALAKTPAVTIKPTLEPITTINVAEKTNEAPVYYGDNEVSIDTLLTTPTPTVMPTLVPTAVPTFAPATTTAPVQQTKQQTKYDYESKFFQDFSKEDRFMIYRIVEAEAKGQGYEPKKNVAAVIFNRLKSDKFPSTVYGVVFQKKQFAPTMDGRYWTVTITEETKEAVIDTYNEGYTALDAEYFANIADVKNLKTKKWFRSLEYLFKDSSGHTFYR